MKYYVAVASVVVLFQVVSSAPSITKVSKIELPGTERINRRSPQEKWDSSEEVFPVDKSESIEVAENGLVFSPLFHAKEQSNIKRNKRSTKEKEEMKEAETGIVYVPGLFRSKDKFVGKQRVRRSAEAVDIPEDMETADDVASRPIYRRARGTQYGDDDIFGSRLVFQNQYS